MLFPEIISKNKWEMTLDSRNSYCKRIVKPLSSALWHIRLKSAWPRIAHTVSGSICRWFQPENSPVA
jgi:hypothetical protein